MHFFNDDRRAAKTMSDKAGATAEDLTHSWNEGADYAEIASFVEPEVAQHENEDWTRFSQWIHCMCVVTFDLNLGQALEFVYPPAFRPTEQEISNICYNAFPDSNSGCMGDTKYHMRLRVALDPLRNDCSSAAAGTAKRRRQRYNGDCVPSLRADHAHYWGFVYFRQKRDASLPRGYFQKSFILVTRLPFFNLFYDVVEQLAPRYFNDGAALLERACQQINRQWPELQAGVSLVLPLLEQRYEVHVPRAASSRKEYKEFAGQGKAMAVLPTKRIANELELFHSLGSFIIDQLYTLWELVLLAEPIVVVGTSPADCSHMVQTLVALIAPLEYCAEARPYFTIHDSEFKEITRECGRTPPAVILGVTNPFFVKLLKDWPHMLRLVDNQLNMQQQKQLYHKNVRNSNSVTSFGSASAFKKAAAGTQAANSTSGGNSVIGSDGSAPGLHTKYKPFLKKDKSLIKKVLLGIKTKRPEHVQTALLRRHLLELTQSFMIPLERYMASLMPLQKDISPFKSAPNANVFKLNDFLATLELSGPQLTSPLKGDWKGLYRRFHASVNFRGWYEARHRELQLTLQELQLQALSVANLEHWARDKQEVEIIDMILKLKQKLNLYTEETDVVGGNSNGNAGGAFVTTSTHAQIRAQIACMKELLPHDLKTVVNI